MAKFQMVDDPIPTAALMIIRQLVDGEPTVFLVAYPGIKPGIEAHIRIDGNDAIELENVDEGYAVYNC